MASETYITKEGDMVDGIAYERFGRSAGIAEAILAANPGLATRGPVLPAGVSMMIPIPEVTGNRVQSTRLWS